MKNRKNSSIIFSNFDDIKNPHYGGGGAVAVHEVAKRLSNKYNVTIITGKYENYKNELIDDVMYRRIGFLYTNAKLAQVTYQLLLPFFVLTLKYEVWFESFTPPFSTGLLQLFTSKPVAGVTHFLSAEEKSREYGLPFYLLQNFGLKTYKYVIALSDDLRNKIEAISNKTKVVVIPNGVSQMKQSTSRVRDYMLFIGRLEVDQKGMDLLLEAFKGASPKIRTNLYIAGSGQQKDHDTIVNKIRALNLTKRVKLLGHIVGDEKSNLFSQSKFIVIPSRYEAFSLVALESLAYGKPLVSFNIPGLNWLGPGVSLKAKSFSTSDLTRCIIEMSTNHALRKKLGQNCIKESKLYSWVSVTNKYIRFIESVRQK